MPPEHEAEVFETLVRDLEATRSRHVNTGVVGVKFLFDVLVRHGRADLAVALVTQTTFPSWGYQIREGATTLWERWEHLDSDLVFNSHSHPFSGSVDAWFYKAIGGIALPDDATGFDRVDVAPVVSDAISYATASVQTLRGDVLSSWERTDGRHRHRVVVPGNTTARVSLPIGGLEAPCVQESGATLWAGPAGDGPPPQVDGVRSVQVQDDRVVVEVGSGMYDFSVQEVTA